MAHTQVNAEIYKTPNRYVSDGKFSPEGTVQFRHFVSIDGDAAKFYCDTDLTTALNGEREKLDQGEGVPIIATVDVEVRSGKLVAGNLVGIKSRKASS